MPAWLHSFSTARNQAFFAAALALNSSFIFSISPPFITGWKFWIFNAVLLRDALALSLRFLRLSRVTDMTFLFLKSRKNSRFNLSWKRKGRSDPNNHYNIPNQRSFGLRDVEKS